MITYRDYLISMAASAAADLTDAIEMALQTQHEGAAIRILEQRLKMSRELTELGNANPGVVLPRPEEEE